MPVRVSSAWGAGVDLADYVARVIEHAGLPEPEREHRFSPCRRWRFDFAWPAHRLAVEVEGGTRGRPVTCHACGVRVRARTRDGTVGREVRLSGAHGAGRMSTDAEKYNAAALAGWIVLRYTTEMVESGEFLEQIRQALEV